MTFFAKEKRTTERNILHGLVSLYDPIGLIPSTLLIRKLIHRTLCYLKITWDEVVSLSIENKCENWKLDTLKLNEISGSILFRHESISMINLNKRYYANPTDYNKEMLLHQVSQCTKLIVKAKDKHLS